ncbi:MAG TPA: AbrB/MazE/SpoVT family DNA-binding domain-containing protein [Euryarchaeota archaeon]|nr:AbrB/MazE/SpoVT family DNA-binding domain-containing protein [Euryarchaeota archaeon]
MFAKYVKVGPKGQIVIPKVFRDEFNIRPGSEVLIEFTDDGFVINTNKEETENIFLQVAKSGKKVVRKIDPHEAYESQMEERN